MTTRKEAKLAIWRQILTCTLASESEIRDVVYSLLEPATLSQQRVVDRAWNEVIDEISARVSPHPRRDELDKEVAERLSVSEPRGQYDCTTNNSEQPIRLRVEQ